jgi:hypothetical protein
MLGFHRWLKTIFLELGGQIGRLSCATFMQHLPEKEPAGIGYPPKKNSHLGAKKCFKSDLTVNAGLGISIFISGDGMHGE